MPFGSIKLNDDNEIPSIAFGSGSKWKGHDVTEYVGQAIEEGFSHLDTAQYYANEDSVGAAIHESGLARSDIFVTTKFSGLTSIPVAIENSLRNLGLKYVDLYLVHNPAALKDGIEAGWREFEKIKEDGFARSIGVSNCKLEQLQEFVKIAKVIPAVNQIPLDPYNYTESKPLLEFAAKHKIVIEAYSSLTPITRYPGGPVDKPVAAAAKRLGATPTQVILSWVKSKGAVIVTTSASKEHLQQYLAVADLPPLSEQEITAIDKAGAKGPSIFIARRIGRHLLHRLIVFLFSMGLTLYLLLR